MEYINIVKGNIMKETFKKHAVALTLAAAALLSSGCDGTENNDDQDQRQTVEGLVGECSYNCDK